MCIRSSRSVSSINHLSRAGGSMVDHSEFAYLIDPSGHVRYDIDIDIDIDPGTGDGCHPGLGGRSPRGEPENGATHTVNLAL